MRGGSVQQDAFFSPTTQTPYTDDLTLGYQVDLGRNMSFETNYTYRRTRDILEDYDLELYALRPDGDDDLSRADRSPGFALAGPRLLRLRRRIPARTS